MKACSKRLATGIRVVQAKNRESHRSNQNGWTTHVFFVYLPVIVFPTEDSFFLYESRRLTHRNLFFCVPGLSGYWAELNSDWCNGDRGQATGWRAWYDCYFSRGQYEFSETYLSSDCDKCHLLQGVLKKKFSPGTVFERSTSIWVVIDSHLVKDSGFFLVPNTWQHFIFFFLQ